MLLTNTDNINIEGTWEAILKNDYISINLNRIRLHFYKRNSKVYQIVLNFPQMGTMLFSPVWQRITNGIINFKINWRGLEPISFVLHIKEYFLNGIIKQDDKTILTSFKKLNIESPIINSETMLLHSIWRYELLLKYCDYKHFENDNIESINFTYSTPKHHLSVKLFNEYKLYLLKNKESDIYTMLNAMNWTNKIVNHDGNQNFIAIREASSIIENQNGKANCRGLAIILCEVLLSLGIKARFVTCLPEEEPYDECHVVCIAFSRNVNKWILLDPTNNLYVKNKSGSFLAIDEFRNSLIANNEIFINENTNWNGSFVSKNQFCDYMIKNLIKFNCLINYYPSCDQYEKERITLIPLKYMQNNNSYIKNEMVFWEGGKMSEKINKNIK